ncbi:methyltransferase domain-containing protein [Fertoebacter nigrum]|uniref:Methyltransferase domain-containing protein n=1 Tax=Fertoeibacter niger TaxID=2656921 RepID=A0A8X8H0D1_9RHOB|nr:class I SAM-dependent methyltransferase [Fertoeibacter niger]NUB46497.1 methyltransferase domain-containing protein [Fertoeibacter niger]
MFGVFKKALGGRPPAVETGSLAGRVAAAGLTLDSTLRPAPLFKSYPALRGTKLSDRYREYFFAAKKHGLAEVEQLVPFVNVPPAATRAETFTAQADDAAGAQALLAAFPPATWGYYLPLSKDFGTLGRKDAMPPGFRLSQRRSDYRLNFIWQGIEAMLGGSIAGSSVADIACNWGGFSIEAHLRGASSVLGFDIRPENIAKAGRVARHFGAGSIDFRVQDLFTHEVRETHDIVLNLGLMYHISMPWEMMKKTYDMTHGIAVFDTVVHRESFSGFILGTGEAAVGHAATAIGVELHPTYRGLIDMAYMVGFKDVVELHGIPDPAWPDFDKEPYGNKTRRCIVAFK